MPYLDPTGVPLPLDRLTDNELSSLLFASRMPNQGAGLPANPALDPGVWAYLTGGRDGRYALPGVDDLRAETARRRTYGAALSGPDYQAAVQGRFGDIPRAPGQVTPVSYPDEGAEAFARQLAAATAPAPAPAPQAAPALPVPLPPPPAPVAPPLAQAVPAPVPAPAAVPQAAAPAAPAQPNPVQAAFGPPEPTPLDRIMEGIKRFEVGPYGSFVTPGRSSSAYGGFQIMPKTYADWVTRYGATNPWLPKTMADLRALPAAEQEAVQRRLYRDVVLPREYGPTLARGGHALDTTNAVAANLMGATGARNFLDALRENPGRPVSDLIGEKHRQANKAVYHRPDGTVRNLGEVYAYLGERSGGAAPSALASPATPPAEAAPPSPASPLAAEVAQPQRVAPGAPEPGVTQASGIESNPYRARMFELLQKIEGERSKRPEWGEVLFRMGTGLQTGRTFGEGLANGGLLVNDYTKELRAENARRDATLVGGYNALANDRSYALAARAARDTYRNTNLEWRDKDGRLQYGASRVVNGDYQLMGRDGQWRPAAAVAGTTSFREANRSAETPFSVGPGGIPGAAEVSADGVPVFSFQREAEQKNYGFSVVGIHAAREMARLEAEGYNPATVMAKLAQAARNPSGRFDPTQILNGLTDPRDRQYAAHAMDMVNAVARQQSGAAIPEGEYSRYVTMMSGMLGDDPTTRGQRSAARSQYLQGLIGGSGNAAIYLQDLAAGRREMPDVLTRQFRPRAPAGAAPAAASGAAQPASTAPRPAPQAAPEGDPMPPALSSARGAEELRRALQSVDPNKMYRWGDTTIRGSELRQKIEESIRRG